MLDFSLYVFYYIKIEIYPTWEYAVFAISLAYFVSSNI